MSATPIIDARLLAHAPLHDLLPPGPLHLDLGTGLGHFLAQAAARYPSDAWLGLELQPQVLQRAARRLQRAGTHNARLLRYDARALLLDAVDTGSLAHIWINFPDPWPKERHAARRFSESWLLGLMLDRLAPGGGLHVATDAPALLEEFERGLEKRSDALLQAPPGWARASLGITTKYERKWAAAGRPLYYADWTKRGHSPDPVYARTRCAAPDTAGTIPTPGIYDAGDWLLKLFRAQAVPTPGATGQTAAATPRARVLMIERATGVETMGWWSATGLELLGVWTPAKRDLALAVRHGKLRPQAA